MSWWEPATYAGIEELIQSKGFNPFEIHIGGSGAFNQLHDHSDVDIFGVHDELKGSIHISSSEIEEFFGFTDNPQIECLMESVQEHRAIYNPLGHDPSGEWNPIALWKCHLFEAPQVYPRIYEENPRADEWRAELLAVPKETVGNWYLKVSYDDTNPDELLDDTHIRPLKYIVRAIRFPLTGAYYLENDIVLTDAKALLEWMGIVFNWEHYEANAFVDHEVRLFRNPIQIARQRLIDAINNLGG